MTSPHGNLRVEVEAFRALDTAFDGANGTLNQVWASVENSMAYLRGGTWGGTAANAYQNSLSGWLSGLQTVTQALNEMREAMVAFAGTTATTEDDNIAAANNVGLQGIRSGWAGGGA